MKARGYIYAITMEGSQLVKIGHTSDSVLERLSAMQSKSAEKLAIKQEILVEYPETVERWLHEFLAGVRVFGEWFKLDHRQLPALVARALEEMPPLSARAIRPPTVHRQRRLTLRISHLLAAEIQTLLESSHMTISDIGRAAIEHYVQCPHVHQKQENA